MSAASATKPEFDTTALFDQAVRAFGDAVKAGAKIQEEVGKWWSDAIESAGPVTEWQKKARQLLNEVIPVAQKNTEDGLRLFEQNYRKSMGLLKKAFDTNGDAHDLRAKTQQLWEDSLELIRDNTQALAEANRKVLEQWSSLLKKNVETVKVSAK
jgi:hypothetical protein